MAIRLDGANPKAAHVGEVHRGTVESAGHGARVEPFEFERPAWRNLWQEYCFQSGCGSYALGVGFPCFTASREEGNTQIGPPYIRAGCFLASGHRRTVRLRKREARRFGARKCHALV